jgi:hypothetical protein
MSSMPVGEGTDWEALKIGLLFKSKRKQRRRLIPKPAKGENSGALASSFSLILHVLSGRLFGRYEVHEKLQNFMVPVPVQGSWHEEQVDELFASLLGKGFENAGGIYGADVNGEERDGEADKRLEIELGEALKGGFRVFG